jgi:hypothetical protein
MKFKKQEKRSFQIFSEPYKSFLETNKTKVPPSVLVLLEINDIHNKLKNELKEYLKRM